MKKCPKCNVDLPDDAAFCGNCGANLSEESDDTNISNNNYFEDNQTELLNNTILESAKAKNKNAKLGLIAIISVAAIIFIVLIIIICNAAGGGSYKKPVKDFAKFLNDNEYKLDVEDCLSLVVPPKGMDAYKDASKIISKSNPSITDDLKKALNDYSKKKFYKKYIKDYGDQYTLSISITNNEKITKDDDEWDEIEDHWKDLSTLINVLDIDDKDTIKELSDKFKLNLDDKSIKKLSEIGDELSDYADSIKIQDIRKLKIKTTVKGNDDESTNKSDLYVVKINGKWIIDFTYNEDFISLDTLNTLNTLNEN